MREPSAFSDLLCEFLETDALQVVDHAQVLARGRDDEQMVLRGFTERRAGPWEIPDDLDERDGWPGQSSTARELPDDKFVPVEGDLGPVPDRTPQNGAVQPMANITANTGNTTRWLDGDRR